MAPTTDPALPPTAARPEDPPWARGALVVLLVTTAALYLWGLGASGWANSFYSAAVQAGAHSWKAFFFGSSDAASSITVDKPPASLWVMELSARVFGVSSWSILVPQALEGVAAVAVLYAAVKRWFGASAGLLAGAALALTPVAALMFRFNNPDALLTLLLTIGAYCMVRAVEDGRTRWLVLAGTLIGFGFLTKMLQAFAVVPAFGLVYLVAGPPRLARRLWQLTLAGIALVVASLWWVVAVMAVPASSRPYIGGSQDNSLWNLIFGYNGFGRLTGNESGSVGGGGPTGAGRWGPTGLLRLFNDEMGGQIAWLLPGALILLVGLLALTWSTRRTNRIRASMLLWGGWLVVTALLFSLGQGIIHPYYNVALAPAVGAIVGIGAVLLWRRRHDATSRAVLAVAMAATALMSYALLRRTPTWHAELQPVVLWGGLVLAALVFASPWLAAPARRWVAGGAVVVALLGPGAYTVATVADAHTGAIPTAGPSAASALGFPGRGGPPGAAVGRPTTGGLLEGSSPSAALVQVLEQDGDRYEWLAAAVGSNVASGYQLATDGSVMPIGGFNGTDPSPTLAEFQADVAAGKIHWFIATGGRGGFGGGFGGGFAGPGGGDRGTASAISSWVESTFTARTVGNVTLYDLTAPTA